MTDYKCCWCGGEIDSRSNGSIWWGECRVGRCGAEGPIANTKSEALRLLHDGPKRAEFVQIQTGCMGWIRITDIASVRRESGDRSWLGFAVLTVGKILCAVDNAFIHDLFSALSPGLQARVDAAGGEWVDVKEAKQ